MLGREYTPEENARIAVATQLRQISHDLMRGDHDPDELHALAGRLGVEAELLAAPPDRVRDRLRFDDPESMPVPGQGEPFFNAPDRPFSGVGTPWSVPMHVVREGDRAVTELVLGPAFEGAPLMSHGGIVAGIFDDLLGFLLVLQGTVAFTAYLTVNYHQATKLGELLRFEAWVDRVDDKKLFLSAECHSGGQLITSSNGLFIDASQYFNSLATPHGSTTSE